MNSPFVIDQAKALAASPGVRHAADNGSKITLCSLCEVVSRQPDAEDLHLDAAFHNHRYPVRR